ncbi:hypothetical protein FA95DRAFT_1566271 [Auriscalpium vulgare]|uniref:Uncharacterized protein n=1 Tax=Auriscalpium vulgare TaxID=40419 RepID=A0ACB8R9P2_9AGAM|nr:hypothetical protein FA95DRAFT_1566271 [Auriscalpium vulgare]
MSSVDEDASLDAIVVAADRTVRPVRSSNKLLDAPIYSGALQPGFDSHAELFEYLQALLAYAEDNKENESSLYALHTLILSLFCMGATVRSRGEHYQKLRLGCFPQKDLKAIETQEPEAIETQEPEAIETQEPEDDVLPADDVRGKRIPDVSCLLTQGLGYDGNKLGNAMAFLVEIKPGVTRKTLPRFVWRQMAEDEEPMTSSAVSGQPFIRSFTTHVPQVTTQAIYARAMFGNAPVSVILILDVWFMLFKFHDHPPDDLPHLDDHGRVPPQIFDAEQKYCKIPPSPIFNETWTDFSPIFLMALRDAVSHHPDFEITPHPYFTPPADTAQSISAEILADDINEAISEAASERNYQDQLVTESESTEDDRRDRNYRGNTRNMQAAPAVLTRSKTKAPQARRSARQAAAAQGPGQASGSGQGSRGGGQQPETPPRRKVDRKAKKFIVRAPRR